MRAGDATAAAADKAGASDAELEEARAFQRKAQWHTDFVNAENSMGFHSPQETARNLGLAIDYARQGMITLAGLVAAKWAPHRFSRPASGQAPGGMTHKVEEVS
jgi:formate-dependent nitrite reductase cytochrome c552 subunit